ncbi:MAG: alcohol dehydrogenase catalytic domain-containing protein [Planctomycetes bacterium]|nr:alcohol dehydrogenase catalytic domain-containing protein [Planctomycetota bacterium]
MLAAVLYDDGKIEMRELPDPEPGPGQVLLVPRYASICGTDQHVFQGEFKGRVEYPAVLGHEFSALVEAVGEGVEEFAPGDRVAVDPIVPCMHCAACVDGRLNACRRLKLLGIDLPGGFAQRVVAQAHACFRLPEEVTLHDAALTELFSLGIHACRRAQIEPGDVVVILGAGKLGLSVLSVARLTAADTIVVTDRLPYRLEVAKSLGADVALDVTQVDPVAEVMKVTGGEGADRVVEAVGHATPGVSRKQPMTEAAEMVRSAGRVVVMGQGPEEESVFWKPFVWKEAEIIASRVTLGEFPRALRMLAGGRLHPERILTHELPLERVADAFELMLDPGAGAIKVLLEIPK